MSGLCQNSYVGRRSWLPLISQHQNSLSAFITFALCQPLNTGQSKAITVWHPGSEITDHSGLYRKVTSKNSTKIVSDQLKISQDLGNGAIGCKLDNSMLSKLSETAMQDLDLEPDLLIINRFGRSEAEGGGFREIIGKAISMDIPVLTAVKKEYYQDWKLFSDDLGNELSADFSDALAWCFSVMVTSYAAVN